MENLNWVKLDYKIKLYLSPYEDEVIHILSKGHKKSYLVVTDSAYDEKGQIETLAKNQIYRKYKIAL